MHPLFIDPRHVLFRKNGHPIGNWFRGGHLGLFVTSYPRNQQKIKLPCRSATSGAKLRLLAYYGQKKFFGHGDVIIGDIA